MAYDPTLDPSFQLDDPFGESPNKYGGGGGARVPSTPNPGPLFGFGLGAGSGPGFGAGSMAAWRRRMLMGGQPSVASAGRNRYAAPMAARGFGGGGRGFGSGGRGFGSGAPPAPVGGNTNIYGQEMGPDYLARLFDQNAQGAGGLDFALLGALGQAGGFNPLGSPALIEAMRMQAMDSARANEASARTSALMNAGNDPLMQAQAALGARLGGASDMNRGLLAGRAQSALQNQQFLQALSQALLLGERGLAQQIHGQRVAKDIQGEPGFMDFLGGLLGQGGGVALGRLGV